MTIVEYSAVLDVIVIVGTTLSTLGCLSLIISYAVFKKLRNLLYRITLYHAIAEGIQAIGLALSTVLRFILCC
jgi:hypothetical protein